MPPTHDDPPRAGRRAIGNRNAIAITVQVDPDRTSRG
jgi:hypothetical protein